MINRPSRYAVKRFSRWWRHAGNPMRLAVFIIGSLFLAVLVFLQRPPTETQYPASYLLFFVFGNLAIVILLVLVFLVGRNVVKLIFDRRRNILGSKLRLKLVTSFVGLILVPTTILFALANGLLNAAIEGWFSAPVDAAVSGSVDVAREHYALLRELSAKKAEAVLNKLENHRFTTDTSGLAQGNSYLEAERTINGLYSIRIVENPEDIVFEATHAAGGIEDFKEPSLGELEIRAAKGGKTVSNEPERGASKYFRVYSPLKIGGTRYAVVTTQRVSPEFSGAMKTVNNSRREYEQLKFFQESY